MNIVVSREALLKPLQALSGVVEKKQTLPILANVLLSIKDGKLLLTGTDLEVELIGFVEIISCSDETPITVSARKLLDICRTLPEGVAVTLELEKNFLRVRAGECGFKLNTLSPDDFPNLEDITYTAQFSIKQRLLRDLFDKTYFAMGLQDVRHYLNGCYLDIQKSSIKCVAADGHRLALTSFEDESIGDIEAKVILPRKSVFELMRLLTSDDELATVYISDSRLRITTADFVFTTKLISAQYPDYKRLIPRGTNAAIGEREVIKQALVRASILSNEKFRGIRFQLEPSKLRITANNADQEHAEEALPLTYEGGEMEIGFNVAYLLDVVSAISSKMIRCIFTSPNEGILIESLEADNSLYVIMPMRL